MQTYYFASTYGSGGYNSSTYNGATQTTTGTSTGNSTAPAPSGTLANTGFDVLVAVSVACLILFVALLARFWKRKDRTAVNTAAADSSRPSNTNNLSQ